MKVRILTAHGYISFQPDGRVEYRKIASVWETIDIEGLDLLTSFQPAPDPTGPTPVPPVDALLGCGAGLQELALVECLHRKISPAGSLSKAFELTRRVAWGMRATGAGLLLKAAGENIIEYHGRSFSASRVCWPDGRIVKVLSDVPTTNGPTWQDNGTVAASLYVPALDPRA